MTKGMTASFFHRSKWSPSGPTAEKLLASYPREVVNLAEIIQTGIFAAPVTTKLNLLRRWHAALEMPIGGMAANDAFARVVGELLDNVRDAAREDVGA